VINALTEAFLFHKRGIYDGDTRIHMQNGGMAISTVNSQEEAFDFLTSCPLYAFFDWKVQALVD
jgi:hypothetical protein